MVRRQYLEVSQFSNDATVVPTLGFDLDPNAINYLVVDGMHPKNGKFDDRPFGRLMSELTRYLASTLPSVVLKT
eukprot:3920848-Prymnesium_polylepis.1